MVKNKERAELPGRPKDMWITLHSFPLFACDDERHLDHAGPRPLNHLMTIGRDTLIFQG